MEQTMTQQHTPGHTPLPWTVDYQGRVSQIDPVILDANGAEVVKAWTLSAPHPTDNAAYIVRAVNSHDDLLAALQDCIESLSRLPDVDGAWRVATIYTAKQAIARARGED